MQISRQDGTLLIEVLISISLLLVFGLAIGSLVTVNRRVVSAARLESQAVSLAKEYQEQLFGIKQADWSALAPGAYVVTFDETVNEYRLISDGDGELMPDGTFTRIARIETVARDDSGMISADGAPDPSTRRIETEVSWLEGGETRSVTLTSFMTNWGAG